MEVYWRDNKMVQDHYLGADHEEESWEEEMADHHREEEEAADLHHKQHNVILLDLFLFLFHLLYTLSIRGSKKDSLLLMRR